MSEVKPIRLAPSFLRKVWGAHDLSPWFEENPEKIGEVWFPPPPSLPILVKFLFTSEPLSIQVHPGDEQARAVGEIRGKHEMWHILRADAGARIALGFREPVSRERLRDAAESGEIGQLLEWFPVAAGQVYDVPAGTVHAIGPGVALCEIQQNSDVTYRLFDYGRGRELHLDQAMAAAVLERHPGPVAADRALVACPYFTVERITLAGARIFPEERVGDQLFVLLSGCGTLNKAPFAPGEVWLVPQGDSPLEWKPAGSAQLLRVYQSVRLASGC